MIETYRTWPNKIITRGVASVVTLALGLSIASSSWAFSPSEQDIDGEQLYGRYCAQCHEGQVKRAPHREVLSKLPAEMVLHSLEVGKMRVQGWIRTSGEKRAMSEWITGKKLPPPSDKRRRLPGFVRMLQAFFLLKTVLHSGMAGGLMASTPVTSLRSRLASVPTKYLT